jgi:hypothetical protein
MAFSSTFARQWTTELTDRGMALRDARLTIDVSQHAVDEGLQALGRVCAALPTNATRIAAGIVALRCIKSMTETNLEDLVRHMLHDDGRDLI